MVAPLSCPGLKVEILVDGQPLQEYDYVDAGSVTSNTTTKYIQAQSNAHFAERVTSNHDFPFPACSASLSITLDQQYTTGALILGRERFDPLGTIVEGLGARIGHDTDALHEFSFVALDLIESDDINVTDSDTKKLDSVGTISVKLQFVRNERLCQPNIKYVMAKAWGPIPEKALKGRAKSHHVSLGQPLATRMRWWEGQYIGSKPFVTVNFKYCSVAALRALQIIPREPTPLPLEERLEDDLNAEELRQVVRLLKERNSAALKVKTEAGAKRARSSTEEDDEVEIVEEPSRKRRRGGSQEVIVLD